MKPKPPSPTVYKALGALSGMGFTIAIPIVIGIWLGIYLDDILRTRPVFLLIGLLLGLIAGIVGAFQLFRSVFQNKRDQ